MCDRGEGKADLHTDDGTIGKQSCFSVRGVLVRQALLESRLKENSLICTLGIVNIMLFVLMFRKVMQVCTY